MRNIRPPRTNKLLRIFMLSSVLLSFTASPLFSDTIVFRSGRTFENVRLNFIDTGPRKGVEIKLKSGEVLFFPEKQILQYKMKLTTWEKGKRTLVNKKKLDWKAILLPGSAQWARGEKLKASFFTLSTISALATAGFWYNKQEQYYARTSSVRWDYYLFATSIKLSNPGVADSDLNNSFLLATLSRTQGDLGVTNRHTRNANSSLWLLGALWAANLLDSGFFPKLKFWPNRKSNSNIHAFLYPTRTNVNFGILMRF